MIFFGAYVLGLLWEKRETGKTIDKIKRRVSTNAKTIIRTKPFCFAIMLTYYYVLILYTLVFRVTYKTHQYQLELFWSYKRALDGSTYLYYEIVLNYLLLFPVGVLVCILLPRKQPHSLLIALLLICFSSIAIELSQLLLRKGLFEFDDIIGNVLGGSAGYILCAGVRRLVGKMMGQRKRT